MARLNPKRRAALRLAKQTIASKGATQHVVWANGLTAKCGTPASVRGCLASFTSAGHLRGPKWERPDEFAPSVLKVGKIAVRMGAELEHERVARVKAMFARD